MSEVENTGGTLAEGEAHPAAYDAKRWMLEYVGRHDAEVLPRLLESFCSVGLSGNRLAECCGETLRRLLNGEPVSDRYLLGLAWTMRDMEELTEAKEYYGGEA